MSILLDAGFFIKNTFNKHEYAYIIALSGSHIRQPHVLASLVEHFPLTAGRYFNRTVRAMQRACRHST
jgi:hypothetical protein